MVLDIIGMLYAKYLCLRLWRSCLENRLYVLAFLTIEKGPKYRENHVFQGFAQNFDPSKGLNTIYGLYTQHMDHYDLFDYFSDFHPDHRVVSGANLAQNHPKSSFFVI